MKKVREILKAIKGKIDAIRKKDIKGIARKKFDGIIKNKISARITVIVLALSLCLIPFLVSGIIKQIRLAEKKLIKVSGNIEGTEIRLSFRVEEQMTDLLTDEGMVINVGDVIARLNKEPYARKQEEALAALKAAEHDYKLAHDDHIRAHNLYLEGSISDQEREKAEITALSANEKMEEKRAALLLANLNLGYTDLAAPLDGFVLTKSAEAGEFMKVGATVVTTIDLNDIWLTAYINERDLGRVKLNQKAYIVIDSFPRKKYDGWVSYISQQAEFTPKYVQTTYERVKLVYRIKIRTDNSKFELKPGMPGDGYIIVE
ncbi:MAG: efflux RND transporter periplasmic adaptor subunit [Candidatus Omnitrophota bacterium]